MGYVLTLSEALTERQRLRQAGQMLVFTNGLFDLLHAGHVDYLERARSMGQALFVGLNDDASARRLKGEQRPIVPAPDRARLLSALQCVDAVILFSTNTAVSVVSILAPDVYVKGGDYRTRPLPEAEVVQAYGGRVELLDLLPERSTTTLIRRIVERYCPGGADSHAG